jgi:hypothetical protein
VLQIIRNDSRQQHRAADDVLNFAVYVGVVPRPSLDFLAGLFADLNASLTESDGWAV